MLDIRTLLPDELHFVWQLKEQAGWNQTRADLLRFRKLAGDGWFLALRHEQPCGTVATFKFGPVAWIAMMLVEESLRGQGIGRALMTHAISYLGASGIASICLDATPQGRPLYESLGFVTQFELTRYGGAARPAQEPIAPQPVLLQSTQHQQILDFDRRWVCTDRSSLIRALLDEHAGEFRTLSDAQGLCGYLTARPGCRASFLGPCIAAPHAGAALLRDALHRFAGQSVLIDFPKQHPQACEIAVSHGLSPQRLLTRMCRGTQVIENIAQLWASSGPETG